MRGTGILAPLFVVVALFLLGRDGARVSAQTTPVQPSFSGEWRLLGSAPSVDAAGRVVLPALTIVHAVSALTITASGADALGRQVITYRLDGLLSVNVMDNGDQVRSKVRWQGDALVADGIGALGEEVVTIHETRRLEDAGETMVVETRAVTNLGGARTHSVVRYRKQ